MSKMKNVGLVLILVVLVFVIVALSFVLFNNKQIKANTADVLNTKFNVGAVNLTKIDAKKAKEPVDFLRTESAGSAALKVLHMNFDQFQAAISKVTYEDLKAASVSKGSDKDMFTLANEAIKTFRLRGPKVSPKTVNKQTFTTLIDVLNVLSSVPDGTTVELKTLKDSYIKKFKLLIKKA